MKNISLLAVFIFASLASYSQARSSDTLYWSETAKLEWKDFEGKADSKKGRLSQATIRMDARFRKGIKATTSVQAFFHRKLSCILEEEKTPAMLKYYQTLFDLYEVQSRKLRKTLKETKLGFDPEQAFQKKYNAALKELEERTDQYMEETENGENSAEIEKWSKTTGEEIKSLEAYKR